MQRIIVLSGIPGMGKTTYAKSLGMKAIHIDEGMKIPDSNFKDDFVVDWIFINKDDRKKILQEIHSNFPRANIELHWFAPNVDLIFDRRGYDLSRCKNFVKLYDIPTNDEGWHYIKKIESE